MSVLSKLGAALSPAKIIALALLLVLGVAYVAVRGGGDDDSLVYGTFADASPLDEGSEVRASGVRVGSVHSIELDGKVARVGLDLDESVLPLHEDATMTIRPINLLGENYVVLDPGSPEAPELDGTIPVEQTKTDITLQAVLDTFDDPTSTGLAALVSELGAGVDGSGAELGEAIKALGPAMNQIDELGDILRQQNEVLSTLIANADPVAAAVSGKDGERIDALIAEAKRTLRALAVQRTGVESTLAELPATLREAERTLAALDTVADSTTPTLAKARPITDDLETIAGEITEFSKEATPAFAGFDGVFAEADKLLREAAPLVRSLSANGPALERIGRNARPALDQLLDQHLGDLMAFVKKWSLSTNGRDAISHYFRGVVHVTPESLLALVKGTPTLDLPTKDDKPTKPLDDLLPDLDLPDLPLGLDDPLEGLIGNGGLDLGGLLGRQGRGANAQDGDPNSATGLTSSQESDLLSQLLGTGGKS